MCSAVVSTRLVNHCLDHERSSYHVQHKQQHSHGLFNAFTVHNWWCHDEIMFSISLVESLCTKRGRLNQIGYFYARVSWNLKSDHPWLMVGWVNILIAYICKTLNEWTMDWWMISWDCKWWECHGIMFSIRPSLAINSGKYLHFSVRGRLNWMNGFALQWDEISGLHKLATHGSLQWLR